MRPQNQTLMALIMACVMSLGFLGVYATGYYYNQNSEPETVFVSDSNMEFGAWDMTADFEDNLGYTSPQGFVMTPQYWYMKDIAYGQPEYHVIYRNNCTTVYLGNETWGGAITGYSGTPNPAPQRSLAFIPVLLPELNTYLLSNISITMSLPGDSDQTVNVFMLSVHNPYDPTTDTGYYTTIQSGGVYNSETEYSESFDLSQYQTLKIYSDAKQNPYHLLVIEVYDSLANGFSSYDLQLNIELSGVQATTWTQLEAVELVLGISIAGNVIVMAYMTDSLDFGGYRKDLPGKRGWSPKRKSGKRR